MGANPVELLPYLRATRLRVLILWIALASAGCSSAKQDYVVIGRDSSSAGLDESRVVAEGTLSRVAFRVPPLRFRDYLYGWLLPIGGPPSDRIDADLTVERVLRGDPRATPIKLRHLRFETPEELKRFPDRYAFHNRLHVRVGYEGRRGDRFVALRIVPLDSGPVYDELGRVVEPGTKPSTTLSTTPAK
jgi:hypothetical protein